MIRRSGHRPIALVSSLLHHSTMVGYNRYSISLTRELVHRVSGELAWVPLPAGVHPKIHARLSGTIAPSVRPGWLPGSLDWAGVERRLRPALWHVLTDLPVPLFVRGPVVVTCHGLPRWYRHRHMVQDGLLQGSFWDYQDHPPSWGARRAMAREWLATRCGLLRATAIIADSEYVRWELVTKLRISAQKIHLVHLAPDPVFSRARSPGELEAVRRKHSLPERFVLGVASFSKTKNTEGLLHLASGLAETGLPPVVLIGPAGMVERYAQLARNCRLVQGRTVYLLHNIPDDDLACLYRSADVFVNLAWEESFGLPIVEAMSGGTAVVGSNLTAVPEVIGSGGLLVDPARGEEVLRTVREILIDANLRDSLRAKALLRAREFSWDRAAKATLDVYDHVLT